RDYVYIPLGGSRVSKAKVVRNTFVIFLLSGLWHGANWTFLAWGFYHACLFLPLILLGRNRKYTDEVAAGRWLPTWREAGQMLLTFALAAIGWVIFRAESIGAATQYLTSLFTDWSSGFGGVPRKPLVFIAIMLLVEWVNRLSEHGLDMARLPYRSLRYAVYLLLVCLIFLYGAGNTVFIYFQF
ncbi:MAG: MBOAT family protein, partial [Bacteroidales bacterium]|nr:MBOAT family protein [Bacteroidales bacterium]